MEKITLIAVERVIQSISRYLNGRSFRFLLAKREERKRTKPFVRYNPNLGV